MKLKTSNEIRDLVAEVSCCRYHELSLYALHIKELAKEVCKGLSARDKTVKPLKYKHTRTTNEHRIRKILI